MVNTLKQLCSFRLGIVAVDPVFGLMKPFVNFLVHLLHKLITVDTKTFLCLMKIILQMALNNVNFIRVAHFESLVKNVEGGDEVVNDLINKEHVGPQIFATDSRVLIIFFYIS